MYGLARFKGTFVSEPRLMSLQTSLPRRGAMSASCSPLAPVFKREWLECHTEVQEDWADSIANRTPGKDKPTA